MDICSRALKLFHERCSRLVRFEHVAEQFPLCGHEMLCKRRLCDSEALCDFGRVGLFGPLEISHLVGDLEHFELPVSQPAAVDEHPIFRGSFQRWLEQSLDIDWWISVAQLPD